MSAMQEEIKKLINIKTKIKSLNEEISDLEDSLLGLELTYQGNHASVMFVNGHTQNATLYVEDGSGESWEVVLPLHELATLV